MTVFAEALITSLGTSLTPGQPLPFSKSGGTLSLDWKTQPPLVGSTTLSSTAGELKEELPAPPRRGVGRVAIIGALAVVVGAGAFIATRASHQDAPGNGNTTAAQPPEAHHTETVAPTENPAQAKPVAPAVTKPSVPGHPAEPPPVAAAPARIPVEIATSPAEARLVDANDGHLLGVTPWRSELPSGQGSLKVRIEKSGYKARTISIPLDHAFDGNFELDRAGGHHGGGGEQPSGERIIKL
jgi:hypothetical protein